MRQDIFAEIESERAYQDARWGDADAARNTPNDYVTYMSHYSTKWLNGEFRPFSRSALQAFRTSMLKSATIAVAAIEATDRILSGETPRPDVVRD